MRERWRFAHSNGSQARGSSGNMLNPPLPDGSGSVLARVLPLLALLLICLPGICAGEKPKAFAVIAGTVFHEPGFMLPGAEVELRTTAPPPGVKHPKPMKALSDGRGEFAFHVPAGKAEYTVSAKAKGFADEEKLIKIDSEERVDIYFTLRAVK